MRVNRADAHLLGYFPDDGQVEVSGRDSRVVHARAIAAGVGMVPNTSCSSPHSPWLRTLSLARSCVAAFAWITVPPSKR